MRSNPSRFEVTTGMPARKISASPPPCRTSAALRSPARHRTMLLRLPRQHDGVQFGERQPAHIKHGLNRLYGQASTG